MLKKGKISFQELERYLSCEIAEMMGVLQLPLLAVTAVNLPRYLVYTIAVFF